MTTKPLFRRYTDEQGNDMIAIAAWFYDEIVKCLPWSEFSRTENIDATQRRDAVLKETAENIEQGNPSEKIDAIDGWKLVPIEPDFNMKMHGLEKINIDLACSENLLGMMGAAYKSMLSAAPQPPIQNQVDSIAKKVRDIHISPIVITCWKSKTVKKVDRH